MIRTHAAIILVAGLASFIATQAHSSSAPGTPGAHVVYLVQSCTGAGLASATCFETLADLQDYLWAPLEDPTPGIHPDASSPIVVDIGVGTFEGNLSCPSGGGHVTFRGVGRDHTRLVHPSLSSAPVNLYPVVVVEDCEKLEFQDLSIVNSSEGVSPQRFTIAVLWRDGGSSTWTDVNLEAGYAAWLDATCDGGAHPVHYFYGSLIASTGNYAYRAFCGEHWFYGSEIRMQAETITGNGVPGRRGFSIAGTGDVRVFGSSVRVLAAEGFEEEEDFIGVHLGVAEDGGEFHMHGGIISVSSAGTGNDAIGIDTASATSFAHTLDTAFVLLVDDDPETAGDKIRLRGSGKMQSPLLWQAGDDVPAGGIESKHGQDLFVETDCDVDGDCGGSGDQAHLMIYDDSCATEKWRNVVTGRCRNDTTP